MTRWICLLALLGLPFACSSDDRPPELGGNDGNGGSLAFGGKTSGSAGETGEGGGGTEGGAPNVGQGGSGGGGADTAGAAGAGGEPPDVTGEPPLVELTSPLPASDPNVGPVLHEDSVVAACRVRRSSTAETSSVRIETFDRDGAPLDSQTATSSEQNAVDRTYSATFALGQYPTGRVSFVCTASDVEGRQGSARTESFIDHGPKITPVTPANNNKLPFEGEQVFEFKVEPQPLADGDSGSAVGDVVLRVGGAAFPLTPVANEPNTYRKVVNFDAENIPVGPLRVVISATNKRKPEAVDADFSYDITVDGEGPNIQVVSPPPKSIVGHVLELVFTVTDELSAVEATSITVKLNKNDDLTFQFSPGDSSWSSTGERFTLIVDRSEIVGSIANVYIELTAADEVGNSSSQSFSVFMDDKAPIIDLSPPPLKTRIPYQGADYCSNPFVVLGRAVRDGSNVSSAGASVFRAAVWDLTNHAPGQVQDHYAGIQEGSAALYAQRDPRVPLFVVDDATKAGKACRRLNTEGAAYIRLDPLRVAGGRPPAEYNCSHPETTREETERFCEDFSDLTFVPRHAYDQEQVVYGVEPGEGSSCTGDSLELSSALRNHTGWVCLGASVSDNAGNLGISRPLRVCIQDAKDPKPCPLPAPSCTDGCTADALQFDFSLPELRTSGFSDNDVLYYLKYQ